MSPITDKNYCYFLISENSANENSSGCLRVQHLKAMFTGSGVALVQTTLLLQPCPIDLSTGVLNIIFSISDLNHGHNNGCQVTCDINWVSRDQIFQKRARVARPCGTLYLQGGKDVDSLEPSQYNILIGVDGVCPVIQVTHDSLSCRPPETEPQRHPDQDGDCMSISVNIGLM